MAPIPGLVAQDDAAKLKATLARAEAGDANAQLSMGVYCQNGYGLPVDLVAALNWYLKATEAGSSMAPFWLGQIFEKGEGVKPSFKEAAKWYSLAAERDDDGGNAYYAARFFRDGRKGFSKDMTEALRCFKLAAQKGNSSAQYDFAEYLRQGVYVRKDVPEAINWYIKSAKDGDRRAPEVLAEIFENGEGVAIDLDKSRKWYHKAAEVSVLRRPAEEGAADKQFIIGRLYHKAGAYADALVWFRKAADQDFATAHWSVGSMYAKGEGLKANLGVAMKWYKASAQRGDSFAPYLIGMMYVEGEGVPKDLAEAYAWLNVASSRGCEPAKRELLQLEARMPSSQIHQGQERSKELVQELSGEIRNLKELREAIEQDKKGA